MPATWTIDGSACTDLPATVAEFNRVFAAAWKDHAWTGNLDSFNDLLSWINSGVGPCAIHWNHSAEARESLGYPATVDWLRDKVHVAGKNSDAAKAWKRELTRAEKGKGETMFDRLLELMEAHGHLQVTLA